MCLLAVYQTEAKFECNQSMYKFVTRKIFYSKLLQTDSF